MIARALASITLLFALSTIATSQQVETSVAAPSRPNIVVIVADDLDSSSVPYMPAVNQHLVLRGASFSRFFATTPLCCPSRASILRGQYAHNHRVLRNTGEDAGFAAFHESGHETETLATVLDDAGYQTALVGKYLNGYSIERIGPSYIPPGWDYWVAGVDHSAYNAFNYDLNVNGELVHHGRDDQDYLTDVLSGHALGFLDGATEDGQPFFLYLAPYAPHSPATPAPRHKGTFGGASAPRTPAFNERNIQDKPGWIHGTSRMRDDRIASIDSDYRHRLESLLAVDEMVDAVVQRLDERGALENTYVLFLSDNGYFLGEHRQPHGKDAPYDAASRIPLIARGPAIPEGSTVDRLALNIDLLPTILDLASLDTPSFVDGRSLLPIVSGNGREWRESGLLEGFGKETESLEGSESSTPPFQALRGEDSLYVEYETGERELYNLRKDPYQLSNIARGTSKTLLRVYSRHLDALASCAGPECQRLENSPLPQLSGGAKTSSRHTGKRNRPGNDRQKSSSRDKHARAASSEEQAEAVGGTEESVALFRFDLPPRVARSNHLRLRVHVASVEAPGTLIATLELPSTDREDGVSRGRERLAGSHVVQGGWVTLDVSAALGDARHITVGLRGRDGAALSLSGEDSANAPVLDSDPPSSTTKHREENAHRKTQDRSHTNDRDDRKSGQRRGQHRER